MELVQILFSGIGEFAWNLGVPSVLMLLRSVNSSNFEITHKRIIDGSHFYGEVEYLGKNKKYFLNL
jgi:hypothetical protein